MEQLTKYTRPTRYDKYPRGTLWYIEGSDETYIQTSDDDVMWHPLCYVLEIAFGACQKTPHVITKILNMFQENQ